MDVPDATLEAHVPPFALQPLVENAIRHGVARRSEGGKVVVSARRVDGRLQLRVVDDGPGLAAEKVREGIGLRNTRDWLQQLYGSSQQLAFREAGRGRAGGADGASLENVMAALRTVVVEDERLARRKLVMLLSTEPGVELVGECGTAEEAVNLLRAEHPDLVFLDIQLPGMDGFEVLQHAGLENVGHVVVVTAHDRYALKAFDVAAIDYLLKPYDRTRLRQTLARVQGRGTSDLHGRLLALAERLGAGSERLHRLVIREGNGSASWTWAASTGSRVRTTTSRSGWARLSTWSAPPCSGWSSAWIRRGSSGSIGG